MVDLPGLPKAVPTAREVEAEQDAGAIANCKSRGGTWDPERRTCILPTPEPEPEQQPLNVTPSQTEILREDGEAKGVELADGRIFGGLSQQDIDKIVQNEREKAARFEGTQEGGTALAQARQAEQVQQQIAQIGQLGSLDPAVQADINFSQAFTAGGANVLPGLIGGGASGALIGGVAGAGVGSTVTAPLGAVIGAIAGAGTGFVAGIIGNIKEQQRGELQAADIELTNARTNMRQLAMLATQDPANADIYISQYNQQLTRIHQARRQTKAEVSGDLNAWMEDGREQLADFDAFLQEGGIADVYGQKLAIALSQGVPLSINGENLV